MFVQLFVIAAPDRSGSEDHAPLINGNDYLIFHLHGFPIIVILLTELSEVRR